MHHGIGTLVSVLLLAAFAWLMVGCAQRGPSSQTSVELIDSSDTEQLARLLGLTGGSVAEVAIARYAIERFEQEQGRKATTRDVATLVGMMQAMR